MQAAFVAAEDKRFHQHRGIDERGLIRAFIGNLTQSGRPQGGSTITQQLVKNLLVGDDLTYERKMREMIVAARVERLLSKDEILELYLNSVFLGRGSWGIELAARSYFGKSTAELTLAEGALLAALTKGPNFFNPDRHPARVRDRFVYVLQRMRRGRRDRRRGDEADRHRRRSDAGRLRAAAARHRLPLHRPGRARGADASPASKGSPPRPIRSARPSSRSCSAPPRPPCRRGSRATRSRPAGCRRQAAEANLGEAIRRIEAAEASRRDKPAWQQALTNARLPLYDVHWPQAVVVEDRGGNVKVGLADGRIVPLTGARDAMRNLKLHDAVYVRLTETKGAGRQGQEQAQPSARAELRVRPTVQGAAVVLENQTGRILAMAGGFSYPLSQLNRVTQSQRQPGSAIKPVSYLAALARGLQPNTLVRDEPLTLPPIGGANARTRAEDYWTPRNYDGGGGGIMTLRRALELSRNLATANLLEGGIDSTPALSLDRICALAMEAQIYRECVRYYPFVLGAQPVRPIDLAAFFAAIANEGVRPSPHVIESIEQDGKVIYRHPAQSAARIASADGVAFYQLKTMLQGVLQRGTADPDRAACALCRRQDRHHRRRERRLVRGLHQRGHGGGVGRLRQCRRPAPHARRRRHRRQRRGADLRADHPGGVGAPCAAHDAAGTDAGNAEASGRNQRRRRFRRRHPRFTRDGARPRHPRDAGRIPAARRPRPASSTPNTGWCRATNTFRWTLWAAATSGLGRSSSSTAAGRGGGSPWSPRRRPPAFGGSNAPRPPAAAVPTAAVAGGARLLMALRGGGAIAAAGGAGVVFRRRRLAQEFELVETPSVTAASGRAIEAEVDRLFRPAGRRIWSIRRSASSATRTGRRRARSSSNSSASIPATAEPNVDIIVDGTRRRLSRAAAHVCGGGALRHCAPAGLAQARAARDPSVRRADRSGDQAPAGDGGRPGPPARGRGSSTTSIRSANGARAGRS